MSEALWLPKHHRSHVCLSILAKNPGWDLLRTENVVLVELGKPASRQAKSEALGGRTVG